MRPREPEPGTDQQHSSPRSRSRSVPPIRRHAHQPRGNAPALIAATALFLLLVLSLLAAAQ
jgi:hypothetical protein